ncbi:MAG: tetratricopeptide repeat protein [Gammaproteobacteria bacterium]|nr:tetratricopeptide repeat protein [Gammaproteobacteria bacterium]MBT3722165.1 tetratricopeptide repeat protein [Gammaproteobacteria bacterium]MBT4194064.1 tetratricopeptide repeat protein [Gammaproteobacteria bacterium]MBT4451916.1 tetratricopeptide repeat protein [Gammaproteobacteria bacterium]MBT4862158.1 tetratricopeptide repeat protein [Gammaproteobacteria bacterium]
MKGYYLRYLKYALLFLSLQSGLAYGVDESLLLAAQNMLAKGQSVEALDLLDPHEEEYAGDKEYDYLYGLALLDTGEPAGAVFAFQRVLAIEPNFAGARLELGRSYFDMGQMQRAQREFVIVQSQSPPKGVIDVIDKYMAAIESRNLQNRQGWKGFLQLGFGDDSNVNSATSAENFLGFDLTDESRETSSSVLSTLGGVSYDLPFNFDSKFFFKASVNHRANNDASFTSTINYDLLAGYNKSFSTLGDISVAMQFYTADVDGDFNNKGLNITSQLNINFSPTNQMGLFLRGGNVDYDTAFDIKDIDQAIAGLSWAHVFSGQSRVSVVLAAILGQDSAVEDDSPYGRDYTGIRLSASYPVTHRLNFFASVGGTDSDYEGSFFESDEIRTDSLTDFSFGSSWRVNKTWLLKGLIGQTTNTSNIEIFDYDRSIIMLTARSEFLP